MSSRERIGFWSVVSIVLGSQIGSGIFMLPAGLSAWGGIGLAGWLVSGAGAILLALVFGDLCRKYPKTGGPHAFVQEAFGGTAGFFTAWSYWIISWVSSSAVVIAATGYFGSIFGGFSREINLAFEIGLILVFMWLNLRGIKASGHAEFVFTLLKVIPLVILPLVCMPFIKLDHFVPFNLSEMSDGRALNAAALLTFWGFIGVETATTPAGSVENPEKTIPRAIILGTVAVILVYLLGTFAIMGVVPANVLQFSKAPFADATRIVLGGNWHVMIAVVAAIVCIGTLNAWILTSGQIALGAAQDKLFPAFFERTNEQGAPVWGVIISSLGVIPLLFLTLGESLVHQLTYIIDISVTAFLVIYALCVISWIRLSFRDGESWHKKLTGFVSLGFCIWTLFATEGTMVFLSLMVFASGIPAYWIHKKRLSRTNA